MFFHKPYSILTTYDRKLHEKTLKREGYEDFMNDFSKLITYLVEDNRKDDILKLDNREHLDKLLKEYNLGADDSSYII